MQCESHYSINTVTVFWLVLIVIFITFQFNVTILDFAMLLHAMIHDAILCYMMLYYITLRLSCKPFSM